MHEPAAQRVDIDEQARRDIETYQRFGSIRKRLHDQPEFQRDLKGPKLPEHRLPVASREKTKGEGNALLDLTNVPRQFFFAYMQTIRSLCTKNLNSRRGWKI